MFERLVVSSSGGDHLISHQPSGLINATFLSSVRSLLHFQRADFFGLTMIAKGVQKQKLARMESRAQRIAQGDLGDQLADQSFIWSWSDFAWTLFFVAIFGFVMLFDLRIFVVEMLQTLQNILVR